MAQRDHCQYRRAWKSTPVFFPGGSHGQRSLAGYSPQGSQWVGHSWNELTHDTVTVFLSHSYWHHIYFCDGLLNLKAGPMSYFSLQAVQLSTVNAQSDIESVTDDICLTPAKWHSVTHSLSWYQATLFPCNTLISLSLNATSSFIQRSQTAHDLFMSWVNSGLLEALDYVLCWYQQGRNFISCNGRNSKIVAN